MEGQNGSQTHMSLAEGKPYPADSGRGKGYRGWEDSDIGTMDLKPAKEGGFGDMDLWGRWTHGTHGGA